MTSGFFKHSKITASSLTRDALQVRFATEELSGLRKLAIRCCTGHRSHPTEYAAHGVYQLVRNVKVSKVLTVKLEKNPLVWSYGDPWTEVRWPAHSKEEFACAVWASFVIQEVRCNIGRRLNCEARPNSC